MSDDNGRSQRIAELTEAEFASFQENNPESLALCQRALQASMPLGAPTNVCTLHPYPLTITHGSGAYVVDADGNRRVDYNGGYGSLLCGHAHPAITAAVEQQVRRGTHFGAVTKPVIAWAEHMCSRFSLDWVRFSASGTEATMDAIRLARAHTKRHRVVKAEGAYHGSHPDALVSINMPLDENAGPDDAPRSRPGDDSLTPRILEDVVVVPFNDVEAVERAFVTGNIACLIVEPIMFNVGFISPRPNYLHDLRQLCDQYKVVLIFDEVKTAATVAYGGASELYGVEPHLKCFAKAVCGGLPGGAFGGTDDSMFALIENWSMMHVGTLSGNPLTAAAGLAALAEVLTPEAYPRLHSHNVRLRERLNEIIRLYQLPAYTIGVGGKGCLVWADHELRDFRDYARSFDGSLAFLAWVFLANHGLLFAPGADEQWTQSVAHGDEEIELFCAAFEQFAQKLQREQLLAPSNSDEIVSAYA